MSSNFKTGDVWVGFYGNGWIVVTINQVGKYDVNNGSYSKIGLSKNFHLQEKETK